MKADRPLCFVLMPFHKKEDLAGGGTIDFDAVYQKGIAPAVEDAGLMPLRADAEIAGGIIHKPMYERLLLCEYAVADLTTANPNVFYELGVRHAVKPHTTVTIYARNHNRHPFDVNHLRSLPYALGKQNRLTSAKAKKLRTRLSGHLKELRRTAATGHYSDSPLFQLLDGYRAPDVARLKTDVFRSQVIYSAQVKRQLAKARRASHPSARLQQIQEELGDLSQQQAGILVDLFLSYRAVSDWSAMIDLYQALPAALQRTVLVREQLALALNRSGERSQALNVLREVEKEQGPGSETCGLIGRVHKDRWREARARGQTLRARSHLRKAIDAYRRGFETDWRDHYPGVNAVTLMDVSGSEADLQSRDELLPVVQYSAKRRLSGEPDYWDYATMLELAVVASDPKAASEYLGQSLVSVREKWEPESTADNLQLILDARTARGESEKWLAGIVQKLRTAAAP